MVILKTLTNIELLKIQPMKNDTEAMIYVPSVAKTLPIFSDGKKLAGPDNDPWIYSGMNSKQNVQK